MKNWERICRFCFEKCTTNFKAIETSTHEILSVLRVTVDLVISDEPVMCTNCSDNLQDCFIFKKTCLDSRDRTVYFGDDKNNGHAVCEFCMNFLKNRSFTILDIEENVLEKTVLEKYFPELDLASKKPVICEVCHGSLIKFIRFMTISSIVEGKIKEYCAAEGINQTVSIKLNSVLQFTSENVWKGNGQELDVFKMEEARPPKSENETMKTQGVICTLCLKNCENFKTIDGKAKNILNTLLPKIDFAVIKGQGICTNCEEMLTKCFNFRAICLRTHNHIVSYLNNKDIVKLDLNDIYLSKNVTSTGVPEDQSLCGLCMGLVKNCIAISLVVEEGDVLKTMIEQCLPELDLSVIKKPVICASCYGTLEDCFHFVKNCLIIREETKEYCGTPDINSKDKIDSLPFTISDLTTWEVDGNSGDTIKVEEQFCEDRRNPDESEIGNGGDTVKLEQIFFDDSENAIKDVESKSNSYMKMNDLEVSSEQQLTPKNNLAYAEEGDKLSFIKTEEIFCGENEMKHKEENLIGMEDHQFLLQEEIEIKSEELDFNRFEDVVVLPQSETIRMYQCDSCSFQTKFKGDLRRHLLKHKDPLEVTIYKCDFCSFQIQSKLNFKNHLLTHKDPSEVTIYRCCSCLYQTKRKHDLKKHLLNHKDSSEVTLYKCDSCLYQTKHKNYLKKHLLKHRDPSEVTMYKCESCEFQTKRKYDLKVHLLNHKDPSEVIMYRCDHCLYQSKRKNDLKDHQIVHKNPSEVTVYKCDSCLFQTKYKHYLKRHLLDHKDRSTGTMYKCDSCLYQTKRKGDLKKHLLKHKDPSEMKMYKCASCVYQTNRKYNLKYHLLKHKNPSEVIMFKCDACSFQTKHKSSLKDHLLTHRIRQK